MTEKPGRPQSTGSQRVRHDRSEPTCIDARHFLPVATPPSEDWVWRWHRCLGHGDGAVCRHMGCPSHRNYGPIRVFFWASGSLQSEGLFGQSFSIAPPIQALKGLPYLGFFSVVPQVRYVEGPPWLGSYSANQCIRHLKGHPGWGPDL